MKASIVFIAFIGGFVFGWTHISPPTVGWIVTSLPVGFLLGLGAAYVGDRENE